MIQVQIATTRHGWPLQWQDLGEPVSNEEADKIIEYQKWLDSKPPLGDHYRYQKVEIPAKPTCKKCGIGLDPDMVETCNTCKTMAYVIARYC